MPLTSMRMIELSDSDGVKIVSEGAVSLRVGGSLNKSSSNSSIVLSTPNKIRLKQGVTEMSLGGDLNLSGAQIKLVEGWDMKKNNNSKTMAGCFAVMLLVSCGHAIEDNQTSPMDKTETEQEGTGEAEKEPEDTGSNMEGEERSLGNLYQQILEYDFSVQEYPIDMTLYTDEVEKEYLTAFYDVLVNRNSLEYWGDGEPFFFRDYMGRLFSYLSDKGFAEVFVPGTPYRIIDMDGGRTSGTGGGV